VWVKRLDYWTTKKICELVQPKFKKQTCWFQVEVARELYHRKGVVACASTGMGKTLTFWMPLLMAIKDSFTNATVIVVTPLNYLKTQNANQLTLSDIPDLTVC